MVIVWIATIFPGGQSSGWGVYGTSSHWREGGQQGDGGWRKGGAREGGNAVVTALKEKRARDWEPKGTGRGQGCAMRGGASEKEREIG